MSSSCSSRTSLRWAALALAACLCGQRGAAQDPSGAAAQDPAKPAAEAKNDAALKSIEDFIAEAKVDKTQSDWRTKLKLPPTAKFDPAVDYVWTLETNKGTMKLRFFPDVAPQHVTSAIYLTLLGFYDGLTFHRVIPGFMAQGGCPLGTGTGGPGYQFPGEFAPHVKHSGPGVLSTANAGPGTDGSQFFITFKAQPSLDGNKYAIFGELIEGMETLKALEAAGTREGKPKENLEIKKAMVDVEKSAQPVFPELERFIADKKIDTSKSGWRTSLPMPPRLTFDAKTEYFWELETNKGKVKIRLMPDVAPMHVSSTIFLNRLGFYDGLVFHRVITQFMAQGGCPLGNGTGGPGYKYAGEFSPTLKHSKPGLLSMANAGPGTDGSQFFLTFVPTPWLDGKHTIFGEVVEGMETLKALEAAGSQGGQTRERLVLERGKIRSADKAK